MDAVAHVRRLPGRQRKGGFTLVEVIAAMGILAFGLLTLAAMQIHALKQSAAGRHTGDAAAFARTHLEQVHRLPWLDLDTAVGDWSDPTWVGSAASANTAVDMPGGQAAVKQAYEVDWRVSEVGVAGCLRDIEVRVRWAEASRPDPKEKIVSTRRYNWGSAGC